MEHKHTRPYVVKPGDTMYMIAKRYKVPLEVLVAANPQIPNPDLIYPGQVIMIPTHHHHHHHHCPPPKPMPKPRPMPRPMPMPESQYPCLPSRTPRFRSGFMPNPQMPAPQPGQYPDWWMNPRHSYDDCTGYPQNPYHDWNWDYDWDDDWNNN